MPSVSFKWVRAEVTEFWSGDPIDDATLVQKVAEYGRSPGFPPYPPVQEVHLELGYGTSTFPQTSCRNSTGSGHTSSNMKRQIGASHPLPGPR